MLLCFAACQEKEGSDEKTPSVLVSNVKNTYEGKTVSFRGSTISIKFDAAAAWTASLVLKTDPEDEWVSISGSTASGAAGKDCTVRIAFEKNESPYEKTVELWVAADGFEPELVATFTQALSGASVDAQMNVALNTYMHDILKEDYLFADAYNAQEVNLDVKYGEFLSRHLIPLGEVNIADGGYYRLSQPSSGERYIYSNLTEVIAVKAVETGGLGFGPFISTALEEGSYMMAIAPSYVRRGSPAEAAGLRRGDLIYEVNGVPLTTENYYNFMTGLYQNPAGSYKFSFLRFEADENGRYVKNAYTSGDAVVQAHIYDPVLHASILSDPDDESVKIGYLVYESFDLNSQEFLEETIA